jgi:hypothetical protein
MIRPIVPVVVIVAMALPLPAVARDRLGVWNDWGAFRDVAVPRCYAIAMSADQPGRDRETQPYLTVATWPRRGVHGEVHVRLSRGTAPDKPVTLRIAGRSFALVSGGIDAWAIDRGTDAAIIAAMRNGGDLSIGAHARSGRTFRDSYRLTGAASAMDAASLGCAGL